MSTLNATLSFRQSSALSGVLRSLSTEAVVLAQTLLNPRAMIREVEEMRALQLEAQRIEAVNPNRAAALRRRIAQMCR
jgi:hypothetical protein